MPQCSKIALTDVLVLMQIAAAGFTIAPLQKQFVPGGGQSTECLVTLVVKTDFGGWLSEDCWVTRLLPVLGSTSMNAWLNTLIEGIVTLRDIVRLYLLNGVALMLNLCET